MIGIKLTFYHLICMLDVVRYFKACFCTLYTQHFILYTIKIVNQRFYHIIFQYYVFFLTIIFLSAADIVKQAFQVGFSAESLRQIGYNTDFFIKMEI